VKLALLTVVIGVLVFCGLMLALYAMARSWTVRRRARTGEAEKGGLFAFDRYKEGLAQIFKPLGEMVPRSPEDMSRQERRLVGAGFRRKDAVLLLLGSQVATAILAAMLFAASGLLYRHVLLFLVVSVFLGAALPDLWLQRRMALRRHKIQLGLPDALDLAVVCVEAGLGLDQARSRISSEIDMSHPELADELRIRTMEINLGRTRTEAFRNLADRTGVQDLKALVAKIGRAHV
jgi:tight adherence protein C